VILFEIEEEYARRAAAFARAAHGLFASHESSASRVMHLRETRQQLTILNLKQSGLLEEALRAIETSLFRASIVLAWAAFVDFLEEILATDGLVAVHQARPNWSKWATLEELTENVAEHQLIEAARAVRVLTKAEMKGLHGLLSKRNECAHPSGYLPSMNESLGYSSELLNRMQAIAQRRPR
jgi:hypothetical protein